MSKPYTPAQNDIVWLNFQPQSEHEQAGRRPAIVISPQIYNDKTGLALFCPITSKSKEYPFEVQLTESCSIRGVILSDQIKSLDWKAHQAEYICTLPSEIMQDVINKLKTLIL